MLPRVIRLFPTPCQAIKAAGTINIRKCLKQFNIPCFSRYYASSIHIPSIVSVRSYSVQVNLDALTVDFDYVKKATANANTLIVDVREPDEIKEHGKIPNSVNIPLGNVTPALGTMSDKDFQETYKRPKPEENTEIIFYCMIGKRSGMAQQNAVNLGFKNAKNYVGSWTDWATKNQ